MLFNSMLFTDGNEDPLPSDALPSDVKQHAATVWQALLRVYSASNLPAPTDLYGDAPPFRPDEEVLTADCGGDDLSEHLTWEPAVSGTNLAETYTSTLDLARALSTNVNVEGKGSFSGWEASASLNAAIGSTAVSTEKSLTQQFTLKREKWFFGLDSSKPSLLKCVKPGVMAQLLDPGHSEPLPYHPYDLVLQGITFGAGYESYYHLNAYTQQLQTAVKVKACAEAKGSGFEGSGCASTSYDESSDLQQHQLKRTDKPFGIAADTFSEAKVALDAYMTDSNQLGSPVHLSFTTLGGFLANICQLMGGGRRDTCYANVLAIYDKMWREECETNGRNAEGFPDGYLDLATAKWTSNIALVQDGRYADYKGECRGTWLKNSASETASMKCYPGSSPPGSTTTPPTPVPLNVNYRAYNTYSDRESFQPGNTFKTIPIGQNLTIVGQFQYSSQPDARYSFIDWPGCPSDDWEETHGSVFTKVGTYNLNHEAFNGGTTVEGGQNRVGCFNPNTVMDQPMYSYSNTAANHWAPCCASRDADPSGPLKWDTACSIQALVSKPEGSTVSFFSFIEDWGWWCGYQEDCCAQSGSASANPGPGGNNACGFHVTMDPGYACQRYSDAQQGNPGSKLHSAGYRVALAEKRAAWAVDGANGCQLIAYMNKAGTVQKQCVAGGSVGHSIARIAPDAHSADRFVSGKVSFRPNTDESVTSLCALGALNVRRSDPYNAAIVEVAKGVGGICPSNAQATLSPNADSGGCRMNEWVAAQYDFGNALSLDTDAEAGDFVFTPNASLAGQPVCDCSTPESDFSDEAVLFQTSYLDMIPE